MFASNGEPEKPLPYTSALGGEVSQDIIDARKPKPKKEHADFTSALGYEIEYTKKSAPKPIPASDVVTFTSALKGNTQTTSKLAAADMLVKQKGVVALRKQSSVSFAADTKPPKAIRPSTIGYTIPPQKGRTKFGKGNMARDIPIFLSVLSFLFFIAFKLGGSGTSVTERDTQRAKLEKLKYAMEEKLKRNIERHENRLTGCNLFLADSSIPGAGLSLFAGKHYNTNDTVLTSNLAFKLGEESRNLLEFGLILKHHPLLANLNGGIWRHDGDGMSELTASKEILPGHELFLSFNDHPGSTSQSKLFSNIPQPEHYELADEIVKEEMKNQRRGTPRRGNQPNGECSGALKMVQNVVAKFAPSVAQLLPVQKATLDSIRSNGVPSVGFAMMRNRTLSWLELNGRCLDLVERNNDGIIAARMAIKKGRSISIMPLFVTQADIRCSKDKESCPIRPACFGHSDSRVRLCPISLIAHVSQTTDPSIANAEYQWSMWNVANFDSHAMSASQLISENARTISFDVIATKPIKAGEVIVLDIGDIAVADFLPLHDGMFPEHWLDTDKTTVDEVTQKGETVIAELKPVDY